MISRGLTCLALFMIGALFLETPTFAQLCTQSPPNDLELRAALRRVGVAASAYIPDAPDASGPSVNPDEVYRLAAIDGHALLPELHRLARKNASADSVAGAAQVSLAKLGNSASLQEILDELTSPASSGLSAQNAIAKLGRVGGDVAIRAIIQYFLQLENDRRRIANLGDTFLDPLVPVLRVLEPALQDPPAPSSLATQDLEDRWTRWFAENKLRNVTWSVQVPNNLTIRQRCLVRKIRWGFTQAILDLAADNDRKVLPVLRELASVGEKNSRVSPYDTVRGKAQTALAKLGDREEFNAILVELKTINFSDAIDKLRAIGGRSTVEALIDALEPIPVPGAAEVASKPREDLITETLRDILAGSDDLPDASAGRQGWIAWWQKHRVALDLASSVVKYCE